VFHADRETTRADGRTHMMKITVDFRYFVKAPIKVDTGKMFMKFRLCVRINGVPFISGR
jgi:hypothetical protein